MTSGTFDPDIRALAKRITRVERMQRAQGRASQAALRSIMLGDGPVTYYGEDGEPVIEVVTDDDGVTSINDLNQNPPPIPTTPDVVGKEGGLLITWDGTFVDEQPRLANVIYVEVHVGVGEYEATDVTQVATFVSEAGGAFFYPAPVGDELTVKLVTVNAAYLESAASESETGTPLPFPTDAGPDEEPDATTLEGFADSFGFTLVADELAPTSFLTLYMADEVGGPGVAIADLTHNTVFRITTETDGTTALDPAKVYEFWTSVENIVGPGPDSVHVQLQLGAVTSDMIETLVAAKLVAGDLIGAFALLGAIQVGSNISISPDNGIVINLADGGLIRFPSDGSPASITAELIALALTVKGSLRILGTDNEIGPGAALVMSAGVTNPTALATVSYGWPSTAVAPQTGLVRRHIGHDASANTVVAIASYSNGLDEAFMRLETINTDTGAVTPFGLNASEWDPQFTDADVVPYGLCKIASGSYFALVLYRPEGLDVSGTYQIWEISAGGGVVKTEDLFAWSALGSTATPNIVTLGASYIGCAWVAAGTADIRVRRFNITAPNWNAASDDHECTGWDWTGTSRIVRAMYHHPTDDRILVNITEGVPSTDQWMMSFNIGVSGGGATYARDQNYEYPIAYAVTDPTMRANGATHNAVLRSPTTIYRYTGKYQITVARGTISDQFTYVWYDGNATGGTHTTQAAALRTYVYPNRSTPLVSTPPIGDVLSADSPDRIRVYARATGGAAGSYDRWDPGIGITSLYARQDTKAASNQSLPGANSFGAQTPAMFRSSAVDAFTQYRIWFKGDGAFRLGPFEVNNVGDIITTEAFVDVIPWTTLTIASPWAAVAGQTPEYKRDAAGNVHLRGAVTRNTGVSGQTFATLPSGARPVGQSWLAAVRTNTANTPAILEITTGGVLRFPTVGAFTAYGLETMFNSLP